MVDLPGPKIRIGKLRDEPLLLEIGNEVILTTKNIAGTAARIPVAYKQLPGSQVVLNDGFIQLRVEKVFEDDVFCRTIIAETFINVHLDRTGKRRTAVGRYKLVTKNLKRHIA